MGITASVDLNPNHLATVKVILAEHVPECEVRAFGSRTTWTARDYSDLDLAVVGEGPVDWRTLGRLKEALEESDLPMRVDVLDWHAISESFREVIERDYVLVQEGAKQTTGGEWRMCTLGELTDNFDAFRVPVKQRERRPGPYPYYGASGVVDHVGGFLFDGEYLLIAEDGENLRTRTTPIAFLANGKFWVNNHAHIVRGNSDADTRFLKYALSGLDISGYLTGSTMPKLTQGNMNRISLLTPPLPEQRAIAHVLGTLDDKIELNRRMNETLEEMARALFKSWFVDFEPVRAKMEGRWRRGESLPGLPAEHHDLFPDRLVESELGEIPEGWEVKGLGELVELNPREPMKKGTVAPYLEMAALPISGLSPDEAVLREFKSGTRFRNGDTLLARITPCLENGKTAFVQSLGRDTVGWGSTEFLVMRAIPPVPLEYTYLLARDPAFRAHAIQSMTGTSGRQRARTEALAPYLLPVPSAGIWVEFGLAIERVFTRIESNQLQSYTLAAQRDTLLPRLVSGDVGSRFGRLSPMGGAKYD